MKHIIIVEDERIERMSLIQIIESQFMNEVTVKGFSNGLDAWEYAQKTHINLALIDINIPTINGLELVEKLKRIDSTIECIFLTSYTKFDYALEALRLGAKDYLLKPIQKETLITTIHNSLNDSNKKVVSTHSFIQAKLDKKIFGSLLSDGRDVRIHELAKSINIKFRYLKYVIFDNNDKRLDKDLDEKFKGVDVPYITQECGAVSLVIYFIYSQNNILEVSKVIDEYAALIDGLSSPIIEENYSQHFIDSINQFNRIGTFAAIFSNDSDFDKIAKSFLDGMDSVDSIYINRVASRIVLHIYRLSDAFYHSYYASLQQALSRIIYEAYGNTATIIPSQPLKVTNESLRKSELISSFTALLTRYSRAYIEGMSPTDNILVTKAIQYIEDNYTRSISLDDLADFLNITPHYISKLLSNHSDYSFVELVNRFRIKEAMELLETDASIKEIAYQIGYRSSTYFGRVFKSYMGVTPKQYREHK